MKKNICRLLIVMTVCLAACASQEGTTELESLSELESISDSEPEIETQSETETDAETDAETETDVETETESEQLPAEDTVPVVSTDRLIFEKVSGGYAVSGSDIGEDEVCDISIPSTYQNQPVLEIKNGALELRMGVRRIIIPSTVEVMGDNCFIECMNLEEIQVEEDNRNYCSEDGVLFTKDKSELIQCPAKKNGDYDIPKEVKAINAWAFDRCKQLTAIAIPEGITEISSGTFYSCLNLKKVELPDGIKELGSSAFYNCQKLEIIYMPNKIEEIAENAFVGCSKLTEIQFAGTMQEWKAIEKKNHWIGNYDGTVTCVVRCTDGVIDLSKEGN